MTIYINLSYYRSPKTQRNIPRPINEKLYNDAKQRAIRMQEQIDRSEKEQTLRSKSKGDALSREFPLDRLLKNKNENQMVSPSERKKNHSFKPNITK